MHKFKKVHLLLITWFVNTDIAGSGLTVDRVCWTPILISKDCQFSYQMVRAFLQLLDHDLAKKLLKVLLNNNQANTYCPKILK